MGENKQRNGKIVEPAKMNVVQIGPDPETSESIKAAVSAMDLPIQLYQANTLEEINAFLQAEEKMDVVITSPETENRIGFGEVRRMFRGHTIFIVDDEKDFKGVDFGKNVFFIRKPVDPFYVQAHLTTYAMSSGNTLDTITVNARKSQRTIALFRIRYIEGQKNSVLIHTKDEVVKITAKVSDYENLHELLVRCHQSFIVNLSSIEHMEGNKIILTDGTYIPISRTYLKQTRESYYRFTGGI